MNGLKSNAQRKRIQQPI